MKRRLIIALISLAMTLHGAVPMGLAAVAPAPSPTDSLLAALQVICTGQGVIDHAADPGPIDDLPHDCKACPAPGPGTAMTPGEVATVVPSVATVLHVSGVVESGAPGARPSSHRTRAPPVFL